MLLYLLLYYKITIKLLWNLLYFTKKYVFIEIIRIINTCCVTDTSISACSLTAHPGAANLKSLAGPPTISSNHTFCDDDFVLNLHLIWNDLGNCNISHELWMQRRSPDQYARVDCKHLQSLAFWTCNLSTTMPGSQILWLLHIPPILLIWIWVLRLQGVICFFYVRWLSSTTKLSESSCCFIGVK